MAEALAAMGELGIFIRAAERCGGVEEFQAALQVLLSAMSQLARAYAEDLKCRVSFLAAVDFLNLKPGPVGKQVWPDAAGTFQARFCGPNL